MRDSHRLEMAKPPLTERELFIFDGGLDIREGRANTREPRGGDLQAGRGGRAWT